MVIITLPPKFTLPSTLTPLSDFNCNETLRGPGYLMLVLRKSRKGILFFQSITEECLNELGDNLLIHQIVQA